MSDVDYDFDAAWAEHTATAPRVRIFGEVYTLPASVPAKLVLFAAKAKKDGSTDRDVTPDEVLDMLSTLLGPSNLDRIMAAGIGIDQLGDVLQYCMRRYNKLGGMPGEAPAPEPGATSATPTSSA